MQQYEHWANMLYPKMTFKDLTDRIEVLASKKEFKVRTEYWEALSLTVGELVLLYRLSFYRCAED